MGDCEATDGGMFAQTVNAWTSVGYGVAAAVIGWAVTRRRLPACFGVLAGFVVLEGAGSVLYHGRPSDIGQLLHDGALLAMVGFVAGWHVATATGAARGAASAALIGSVLGAAVAGVAALGPAWLINVGVAVGIAAIVVSEVRTRRRGGPRVWTAGPLTLLAVAVAAWAGGHSESPLCEPGSLLQIHGAWHVLSAAVVVVWADRASGAGLLRGLVDIAVGGAAMVVGHTFFRSVEVAGREHLPRDRPVLLIANHPNGFVDPVIVAAAVRRLPRFIAKAGLWKVVPARPLLALAGVLPIHRSGDGDTVGNDDVFASCYAALAAGGTVAIFPEGTTDNRGRLDRIRSGAARIAGGALAGAPDLVVIPVGVAFENRIITRSRALVVIGQPIVPQPAAVGEERAAAAALTAEFAAALAAVSPEFESVDERELLRAAATPAAKEHRAGGWPSFGEIELLARRVAAASPPARAAVTDAYRVYAARLQLIGMTEAQIGPWETRRWGVAALLAAIFALGSIIVPATLIHLPALLLIVVATGLVHSVATKGTVRLLVGLVAGVLTWVVAGMVIADGWGAVWAGVVVAAQGQLALALWTPFVALVARAFGWWRARDRAALLPPVLADRAALVDAVSAAASEAGRV